MPWPWHTVKCQALWGQFPAGELHLCSLWGGLHQDTGGWYHHMPSRGRQGDVEWTHTQMWRYWNGIAYNCMVDGQKCWQFTKEKKERAGEIWLKKKKKWVGDVEHAVHRTGYIYLIVLFSGFCATLALWWLTFIFQCFHVGTKRLLCSIISISSPLLSSPLLSSPLLSSPLSSLLL